MTGQNKTTGTMLLLPCPFCGGEPSLTHDHYVHDDLRPMPTVECKSCSAWVRVEDWNHRAQPSAAAKAFDPCEWTDRQVLDFLGCALRNVDIVGEVRISEIRQGFQYMRDRSVKS